MPPKARPLADRFPEKIFKTNSCWLWIGVLKDNGYGVINRGGRGTGHAYAHRLAWEFANGPIPEGLDVCHTCDIRRCVNPGHLFLGTRKDNMVDACRKYRQQHGERHYAAKLSANQVREIRQMIVSGLSDQSIADEFGVTFHTIGNIRRGHRWKTVR